MNEILTIPIEEYHTDKTAVSATRFKLLWKSPKHFREGPKPIDPKAGFMGNLFEHYLLERDTFYDNYFGLHDAEIKAEIGGKRPEATKAYKEWVELQQQENKGKEMYSLDDFWTIQQMNKSCTQNDTVMDLLSTGEVQQSIFYDWNGVRMKTRPDFVNWGKYTVDIKTTGEVPTPANLQRVIWNYRYDIQAMMQVKGCEAVDRAVKRHFWIFVEKNPPYDVAVVSFDLDDMDFTSFQIEEKIELLKECRESKQWPGVSIHADNDRGIMNLGLPNWVK